MRRPGWCPRAWSSWHLHVSLHLNSWTSLSASFAFFFYCLWASAVGGGNHPRREAPCTIMQLNNSEYPCLRSHTFQVTSFIVHQVHASTAHTAVTMSYYCRCVPGVVIVRALFSMLSIFRQQSWLLRCTTAPWMFCISASLIGNRIGVGFFLRSDLIW